MSGIKCPEIKGFRNSQFLSLSHIRTPRMVPRNTAIVNRMKKKAYWERSGNSLLPSQPRFVEISNFDFLILDMVWEKHKVLSGKYSWFTIRQKKNNFTLITVGKLINLIDMTTVKPEREPFGSLNTHNSSFPFKFQF